MSPSPTAYPHDRAERLAERQPHGGPEFAGLSFLSAHRLSRESLVQKLHDGSPVGDAMEERVQTLSGLAGVSGLQRTRAMAESLEGLREEWSSAAPSGEIPTGRLLDSILCTLEEHAMPLRGDDAGTGWTRAVVERLAARMERHGCVHASYDAGWRRIRSSPNSPEVVARLALAVAWLAWSDLTTRPTLSLVHLNALLKLLDLASAGVAHGRWELAPVDRGRLRAAVVLEKRLLRSWSHRVGSRAC